MEFAAWFRKNGMALSEEQCALIISDFDKAGDARLDYSEFTTFINRFQNAPGGGRAAWEMPRYYQSTSTFCIDLGASLPIHGSKNYTESRISLNESFLS